MPLPRKASPRHRERRSRSRSHSPRSSRRRSRSRSHSPRSGRRRSRSRSHSRSGRDRRRSRSPQRKRSPERRYRSPPRRSPSPRKSSLRRSRSLERRSRSASPRRKSSPRRASLPRKSSARRDDSPQHRSESPENYPVTIKRPADSSIKRHSYRSPSPVPVKRSREATGFREDSPVEKQRYRHSPSPDRRGASYDRTMYADQPSTSKKPLFPAGSSKKVAEIDYVIIVERGPKKEKLNKRFETLEQVAQGPFDFEENITIGIHRGPQHIELDEDEDVEVNYEFNPKTFKMLFPKKEYGKAIFDRDEIKAFRHDDILDEEAYVEKRTISVKPVDKPKLRKNDDELDYKVTVDRSREGYGDRRMVHDSRSGSRPSRSSYYEDIPVTVRLDPKPDPRYEKIYQDQQRYEDKSLMQETVHRNPNDLRYNLMRRKSEGDRDRGAGNRGMMDARSRIEARRQEGRADDDLYDRPGNRVIGEEKKKPVPKTNLPDFKNRPVKFLDRLGKTSTAEDHILPPDEALRRVSRWGHCSICNISLNSEKQAYDHISGVQHQSNEEAFGLDVPTSSRSANSESTAEGHVRPCPLKSGFDSQRYSNTSRKYGTVERLYGNDSIDRKRHRSSTSEHDGRVVKRRREHDEGLRTIGDELDEMSDDDYPRPEDVKNLDGIPPDCGKAEIRYVWIIATQEMKGVQNLNDQLDLARENIVIVWNCIDGLRMKDVLETLQNMKEKNPNPTALILHIGTNDIESLSVQDIKYVAKDLIESIPKLFANVKIIWSQILPRVRGLNHLRALADDEVASFVLECGGHYIRYPLLSEIMNKNFYHVDKKGEVSLTQSAEMEMRSVIQRGILSILNKHISIVPNLNRLPHQVNQFVRRNLSKFRSRTRALYANTKFNN